MRGKNSLSVTMEKKADTDILQQATENPREFWKYHIPGFIDLALHETC